MNRYTPLKRYTPMRTRRPGKPRRGRVRDKKYLSWLHTLPCSVPGCANRNIEAAHVGPRGMGIKCNDREAIPLCAITHHREGKESHHKLQKLFWEHHGLDREALFTYLTNLYERTKA